jgi:hypothetical protein
MGANDLIFSLRQSGFSITLHDDRLQIAPAEKLTNELKQSIRQMKSEILILLEAETNQLVFWRWLVTLPDKQIIIANSPETSLAEMRTWYPKAVAIQPANLIKKSHECKQISTAQEASIKSWLDSIGETDTAIINDVLDRCMADADALAYYIGRTKEITTTI